MSTCNQCKEEISAFEGNTTIMLNGQWTDFHEACWNNAGQPEDRPEGDLDEDDSDCTIVS